MTYNEAKSSSNLIYLDFVGDFMIERWALDDYFDTWITQNYGRSGAGIDYIEMLNGRFNSRQIVVMIGTNDNECFTEKLREEYASRYIKAIRALGANIIYLFSILPCAFNRNNEIKDFNNLIKQQINCDSKFVYIDLYAQFINQGVIKRQLYCDGLHLSPFGYQILTNDLKSIVDKHWKF